MRSRYSSSHTRIWPCIFSNEKPRQRIYSNQQWNQVWFLHCTFCYKGASQLRSYMYLQRTHVGFWAMSSVKVHCNKGAHSHVQGPTWQELNPTYLSHFCILSHPHWLNISNRLHIIFSGGTPFILFGTTRSLKSQSPLRTEAHVLPTTKLGSIVVS